MLQLIDGCNPIKKKIVVKVGLITLSVERKTLSFTRFFERVGKRVDARAYAFPTASVSSLSFGALSFCAAPKAFIAFTGVYPTELNRKAILIEELQ